VDSLAADVTTGGSGGGKDSSTETLRLPAIPATVTDLADLGGGLALAAAAAAYGAGGATWRDLAAGDPPSMADSLSNVRLARRAATSATAVEMDNCFHMREEDVVSPHASTRQNLACLLADLFLLLESFHERQQQQQQQQVHKRPQQQKATSSAGKTGGTLFDSRNLFLNGL